jgi:hypothetical protein
MSTIGLAALLFGTGPVAALILIAMHRRRKHREDVAAWERAQEGRARMRTAGVLGTSEDKNG